jgi:transketolase
MNATTRTTEKISIEKMSINTIRTLSMDAVQKADSGHPGTPMALAPLAYVLWKRFLKFNPKNPEWFDRDRFILSNGHASMLLYSMLYLTGYNVSLDDIKNFRQWGSKTPGHPEYGITPGVETTTGPLGQGIMNSVGMALAEARLASKFNREGHDIINHFTYAFCSDGDFMEGASNEAASVAGHQKLGKLIWIYDNNHITIEGDTKISYSDNVAERFKGYNWHVQDIGDEANDIDAITKAIENAKRENGKPSLIIIRSHIGFGAPNMQDTPEAHGSPLGEDEVKATKEFYDWPTTDTFYVPDDVLDHMRESITIGETEENTWNVKLEDYRKKFPDDAAEFDKYLKRQLPDQWDKDIPHFHPSDGPLATRKASNKIINSFASYLPWIVGGSADLAPSTKTLIDDSDYIEAENYDNRNFAWGIREHAMCAASSGMYLHGGLRPFASTFFIFTDYARPAIRLAALMELPIIYVMTHDSIGLGEDGPTHQPVEQLASFRAMPHLCVIRPADANETAYAWRAALKRQSGPTMLVLTRQKLPVFDGRKVESPEGVLKGAYTISKEKGNKPDIILIGSGSEVSLLLESKEKLQEEDIDARVVSMASWELFKEQEKEYRDSVLPPEITKRLAVETGASFGWCEWVGKEGAVIGVDKFGASAPYKDIFEHYGFTVENVIKRSKDLLGS